jgi:hypothetical protein
VELVEISDSAVDCLEQLLVSLHNINLALSLTVKNEKLEVRLAIALLGGSQEQLFSLVKVARDTVAFHVKDSHPMGAHEAALIGTLHVVAGRLILVSHISGLGMGEFSDGVACTRAGGGCLLHDGLQSLHYLLQIRMGVKPDIVVSLILDRGQMTVLS